MVHVIYDDREKTPWTSDYLGKGFKFTSCRMTEGDYTIKGKKKIFRIERKNSWDEIASALLLKKTAADFDRQIKSLTNFKYCALIVEDTWHRLKTSAFIQDRRITGQGLMNVLMPLLIEHRVPLFTVGRRGTKFNKHMVSEVFKIGAKLH